MKIMNTKRRLAGVLGVLVALCLVGSLGTPVLAVPEMNHQFYGEVTSGGEPLSQEVLAEGVLVEAKINGGLCASTTVDADSRYGWETQFEVPAEVASAGDPIEFYVNGVEASLYDVEAGVWLESESYPFKIGGYTELDLNITVDDTEAPTAIVSPDDTATNVAVDAPVTATFDEDVTLIDTGVSIVGSVSGDLLTGVSLEGKTLTIGHEDFASGEDITVTIVSGVVEDSAGNPNDEISWGFTAVTMTHELTMAVTGSGTTDPAVGYHSYAEGTVVDISATPASGWEFDSWTGDVADPSSASTTVTMDVAKTVTATFTEVVTYDLMADSSAGGSVTEPGEPGPFTYPAGTVVNLLAEPDTGYQFVNWTGDTGDITDVNAASTTITMNVDYSITANFEIGVTYTLTISSTTGGSVTSPAEATSTHNADTVVNLVAVPEEGYTFGWWSGDVVADANAASTTITMDSDKSIVANFIEFSAPENVSVTEIDPGVESVTVTTKPVEELDVTQMPAGIDTLEAYVVEPTGTGSFTLVFTDVSNASDIRIYKVVVDGTWTLLEVTVVDATIEVTMNVADPILVFALPPATIGIISLSEGWNLLSTPIKLDADSDTLEQIFDAVSLENIVASYRWDVPSQQWEIPTGYELSPLEAIYLKVKSDASATAEFIPSGEVSGPPGRELQRGLNLIGPAPALEVGAFSAMSLDVALASIDEAEGGLRGYFMVVSPAHNQPPWSYALGAEVEDLLPYKGYWVAMENGPDTLYGFSTTPIE